MIKLLKSQLNRAERVSLASKRAAGSTVLVVGGNAGAYADVADLVLQGDPGLEVGTAAAPKLTPGAELCIRNAVNRDRH